MKKKLLIIYSLIFSKKIFYFLNMSLIRLGLRGIGILNYNNSLISGEANFISFVMRNYSLTTIFDVGANIGNYTNFFLNVHNVFSFEPNPASFEKLKNRFSNNENINVFQFGFSDKKEVLDLYDDIDNSGSSHASIYKEALLTSKTKKVSIQLDKIDDFIEKNNIDEISLLKIDTEGNEYKVLLGALESINSNKVKIIQFEFNFHNVLSRVYLRDFFLLLPNYNFYRLLPRDFLKIEAKDDLLNNEFFAFQNIVAFRKDIDII